jgi:hypothetical protein
MRPTMDLMGMILDELTLFKHYALRQEVGTCRYFKLEIKTHK